LYVFKVDAVAATNHIVGSLRPTGLRPGFLEKFERRGIEAPRELAGGGLAPGLMAAGGLRG
ncbi:MAG: hypothetical protein ACRDL5_01575, partial [Solirubrobacteraceae bacterium]